jgi:hypothetical protein
LNKQKQVLQLVLRTSHTLGCLLCIACLLSIFAMYFLPIGLFTYVFMVLLSLVYLDVMLLKHVFRRSDDAIIAVIRDYAGRWTLLYKDQSEISRLHLANHFISNGLIVLNLKYGQRRHDLALTKDMLSRPDWHRLKLTLMYD